VDEVEWESSDLFVEYADCGLSVILEKGFFVGVGDEWRISLFFNFYWGIGLKYAFELYILWSKPDQIY